MNRYNKFDTIQRNWTRPPELGHSTPRPVSLNGSGWVLAILAAALLLGSVAIGVLAGRDFISKSKDVRLLEREGREVDARVTRVWRTSGEGKHNRASYEFDAGGNTYRREMKIPDRIWKTLKTGGTLPVRYVPSKPELNHPAALPRQAPTIWFAILVPAGMIVLALCLSAVLRRSMDLLENGRPVPGVVTKTKKIQNDHGGHNRIAEYEFPLFGGGIGKGKTDWSAKDAKQGATLCVVYDPDNPARNTRYPFQLVKVDRN
jgi:hypothetical protein